MESFTTTELYITSHQCKCTSLLSHIHNDKNVKAITPLANNIGVEDLKAIGKKMIISRMNQRCKNNYSFTCISSGSSHSNFYSVWGFFQKERFIQIIGLVAHSSSKPGHE